MAFLVLDTNVYLDADRDARITEDVAAVVEAHGRPLGLSAVVLAELLVAPRDARERERLLAATVGAVEPWQHLVPTLDDWRTAGDALAALGGGASTKGRSFWNDLLIAASCARVGATLMTRDADDFSRIRRPIPVAVVARPDASDV